MTVNRLSLFFFFGIIMLSNSTNAQLQIMPSLNLVTANGISLAGGSVSGRYFVSSHLATGINLRYIPGIDAVMATLEADYFFLKRGAIRPYIGLEAGFFADYIDRAFSGYKAPGIGPKLGLQYKLTSLLDLQLDTGFPIAIRKDVSFGSDSALLVGFGLNFTLGDR